VTNLLDSVASDVVLNQANTFRSKDNAGGGGGGGAVSLAS